MKLALFTVTYSGLWYKGPSLTVTEQITKAREIGFEGIAIEARRPVASPLDLDDKDLLEIREFSNSEGIAICAVETMSNFASPILEQRENNLAMVRETLRMAHSLETNIVKVFAAWPGTSLRNGLGTYDLARRYSYPDVTAPERWRWCVEGIRESAKWAQDYGITLALQNHGPVIRSGYEDALAMAREVNVENVKLCLDVPLFGERQSDEYVAEAVEACGGLIAHSHYGSWNFRESPSGEAVQLPRRGALINYKAFIGGLKRIGYKGFLASEECAPVLVNQRPQGIDEVDRRVRAALKYMRKVIGEA